MKKLLVVVVGLVLIFGVKPELWACNDDNQCKGVRICSEEGKCINPPSSQSANKTVVKKNASGSSRVAIRTGEEEGVLDSGRTGKYGFGLDANLFNVGVGPLARYWYSENIAFQASVALAGDITGYQVRAIYALEKKFVIDRQKMQPYVGLAYISAEKKEGEITYKGKGPALIAGLEGHLLWSSNPNLYWTVEGLLSQLELKGTGAINILGTKIEYEAMTDYADPSFAASLIWYF